MNNRVDTPGRDSLLHEIKRGASSFGWWGLLGSPLLRHPTTTAFFPLKVQSRGMQARAIALVLEPLLPLERRYLGLLL